MGIQEKGRIIAGVDSFTYGHGLRDCIASNNINPGPNPSKYSYVSKLAKRTNQPLINLSIPGGSNERMLYMLKTLDIQPKDTVIMLWSYFTRTPLYKADYIHSLNEGEGEGSIYMKYLTTLSSNNDLLLKNLMYISYITDYIKNIGCKIIYGFLDPFDEEDIHPMYKNFFINEKNKVEKYDVFTDFIQSTLPKLNKGGYKYALDNSHPEEKWHLDLSDYIFMMNQKHLI